MAKTSKIVADRRRREVVARYAERRAVLKDAARRARTPEARAQTMAGLQKLPLDASPTRLRNRDVADGRPRGHLAIFGLSRVRFRQMAHAGELPGIRKSSW